MTCRPIRYSCNLYNKTSATEALRNISYSGTTLPGCTNLTLVLTTQLTSYTKFVGEAFAKTTVILSLPAFPDASVTNLSHYTNVELYYT